MLGELGGIYPEPIQFKRSDVDPDIISDPE